uniref:Endonuclease domain-containing 1 protein-like n=2 Tax=Esox lucius TaxID=8010 RepID=A0AAY5L8A3_ESOLU
MPLYSAYKMDRSGTPKRKGGIINYEPQLVHWDAPESKQKSIRDINTFIKDHNGVNKCPERHPDVRIAYKLRWSQATDDDFTSFDRGHLNPAGHHAEGDGSEATMTFTNVAPQSKIMNNGPWNDYETKLRIKYGGDFKSDKDMVRLEITQTQIQNCHNLYVVTGVVPGNTWQFGRVNVPSYYWSAHCCTRMDQNNEVPVLSGGALCPNRDDGEVEEFDSVDKLEVKLKTLIEKELHLKLNNPIHIFDKCVPQLTRSKSLPSIPSDSVVPLKPKRPKEYK